MARWLQIVSVADFYIVRAQAGGCKRCFSLGLELQKIMLTTFDCAGQATQGAVDQRCAVALLGI